MRPAAGRDLPALGRDHLLIICDPGRLSSLVQSRYPQFEVSTRPSYLAGIAALANDRVRGLLVGVDPAARKLEHAIAGLRKAAGDETRIVLCCLPSGEPATRSIVTAGADDYLIYPPRGEELDEALGLPAESKPRQVFPSPAFDGGASWEELNGLANVLAGLTEGRQTLLERLCPWLAQAMRTAHVRITAGIDRAQVGDETLEPALVETITGANEQPLGQILIGTRQRMPFSVAEAEKLRHYSRIIAHLLQAAEQQNRWQSLALVDEVTQLPNRRYLFEAMGQLLERAARERFQLTVLLFDLDGFKHFNDTYGHDVGDEILRETAQLFRRHCRQHDLVARYGGDEFVVVLWDAEEPRVAGSKHPTDVLSVLRRIRKALESHAFPKLGPAGKGCITISGGLATFPWDAADAQGLLNKADEALRAAKQAGRNRIYLVGAEPVHLDDDAAADAPAPPGAGPSTPPPPGLHRPTEPTRAEPSHRHRAGPKDSP